MDLLQYNTVTIPDNNRIITQHEGRPQNEHLTTNQTQCQRKHGRKMGRTYFIATYLCAKVANHIAQRCS